MNKTVTANVGGFVFNIEENAYETLHGYLKAVRKSLGQDESIDEIMHDIEIRIAELMRETLTNEKKEVIVGKDIEAIIQVMGEPEAYGTEETRNTTEEKEKNFTDNSRLNRQFFRNPDEKMLGGVCSGISAYFGWDPLFLRIFFVIFFFSGIGFLTYIILWIVIPEARTTAEKLKMRGEKIDVENIRQRFNDFKNDVEELTGPDGKKKVKESANRFANSVNELLKNVFHIFGRALGLVLLIFGTFLLIWFFRSFFSSEFLISITDNGVQALDFDTFGESFFGSRLKSNLIFIAFAGFLLAMLSGLLIFAIRLLFNAKFKIKAISITLVVLFAVSFFTMVFIGVQTGLDFTNDSERTEQVVLGDVSSDTLFLDVNQDPYFSNEFRGHDDAFFELIRIDDIEIVYGFPKLDVVSTSDTNFAIEVTYRAQGSLQTKAISRTSNINYQWYQEDSLIKFDPYFTTPVADLIRGQQINIQVKVPAGKVVYLSAGMRRIISDIRNIEKMEDEKMVQRYWMMTEKGLTESK